MHCPVLVNQPMFCRYYGRATLVGSLQWQPMVFFFFIGGRQRVPTSTPFSAVGRVWNTYPIYGGQCFSRASLVTFPGLPVPCSSFMIFEFWYLLQVERAFFNAGSVNLPLVMFSVSLHLQHVLLVFKCSPGRGSTKSKYARNIKRSLDIISSFAEQFKVKFFY